MFTKDKVREIASEVFPGINPETSFKESAAFKCVVAILPNISVGSEEREFTYDKEIIELSLFVTDTSPRHRIALGFSKRANVCAYMQL